MSLILDIVDKSTGNITTILEFFSYWYTLKLNEMNECEIRINSADSNRKTLFSSGNIILIREDSTPQFVGIIKNKESFQGGGILIRGYGYEYRLAQENITTTQVSTSTASATLAGDVLDQSSYDSGQATPKDPEIVQGTHEAGLNIDFRTSTSQSIWNALKRLADQTDQDISITYGTVSTGAAWTNAISDIHLKDDVGSTTSVATLNENIQIGGVVEKEGLPEANKVIVYGKGDGSNQLKSVYPAYGKDATSQTTYGTIEKTIVDRTLATIDACNNRADTEVSHLKDPVKHYSFEMKDKSITLNIGDVVTLQASSVGVENTDVRIVQIKKGMRRDERIYELEVTNVAYAKPSMNPGQKDAKNTLVNQDSDTQMQGGANTLTYNFAANAFGGLDGTDQVPATGKVPLIREFPLPASFIEDEAGNIRVNSFTLDYSITNYKEEFNNESSLMNSDNGFSEEDNISGFTGTIGSGSWTNCGTVTTVESRFQLRFIKIFLQSTSGADNVCIRIEDVSSTANLIYETRYISTTLPAFFEIPLTVIDTSQGDLKIWARSASGSVSISLTVSCGFHEHYHDLERGGLQTASVSASGSNQTIKVQVWNGSSWTTKLTLSSQPLSGNNVDISNGGTLPDAPNDRWRVVIATNGTLPDYVTGSIKLKGAIDSG